MQPFDEIKQYSKTVCEQIRWKKAHSAIEEEIENHLCDQRDAYISQGEDEKTATQKAILQMGDAVSIGMELDRIYRPKPQWTMITLTAVIMLTGMLSNYFIDSLYSLARFSLAPYIIALTVFLVCYILDFSILGKYAKYCYFIILGVSVTGLLFGSPINGGIWFLAGRLSVRLSYLSLIFPLAYSLLIYALRYKRYKGIILCGIAYIPFAIILLLVSSFTGFALFTMSALVILYISIEKGWFGVDKKRGLLLVLIPALIAVIAAIIHITRNPHSLNRLSAAVNPYSARDGAGYIHCLVRDLLANCKFAGKGTIPVQYGSSVPINPALGTDYILTALTHNFGWVVFIGISAIILAFSIYGLYYVTKQKSVLGTIVSLSIMLTFVFQAIIYIINNLGYGMLSALSLPLISYGKSALIINSALIGLMLSVFRTGNVLKDNIKPPAKINSIFLFEDGKLIINLKG